MASVVNDGAPSNQNSLVTSGVTLCCMTAEKASSVFFTLFLGAAISMTVTALILNVPEATTTTYALFSITTIASLILFVIAACKGEKDKLCCMTAEKARNVFGTVFGIAVLALSLTAIITAYPHASTTIYCLSSLGISAAVIGSMLLSAKRNQKKDQPPKTPVSTNPPVSTSPPASTNPPVSTNPPASTNPPVSTNPPALGNPFDNAPTNPPALGNPFDNLPVNNLPV